jgi:CubicO group peptidase (beta-lactamase class C family)
MDWAGLLIERLTESTLEDYMTNRIWNPLGLETMTFFPSQRPDLGAHIPLLSVRVADGTLSPFREPFITTGVTGCFGGQGIYSSMGDYLTFLHSLLANDGRLLCAESVDELFKPQLKPPQIQAQREIFLSPIGALFIGEFEMEKYQHGWAIGGIVFVEGYEDGRRKAGAMSWGGAANCFWIMDREAGLALTFGTQLVPPGDRKVKELITSVEKEIYTMAGVK